MENKQRTVQKARGPTEAYNLSLEIEVWPAEQPRPIAPVVYRATNISMREFQLLSAKPLDVNYTFNFAVLFPGPSTREHISLLVGAARIVQRTQVSALGGECFVLEARIERIQSMWDGEQKAPPACKKAS